MPLKNIFGRRHYPIQRKEKDDSENPNAITLLNIKPADDTLSPDEEEESRRRNKEFSWYTGGPTFTCLSRIFSEDSNNPAMTMLKSLNQGNLTDFSLYVNEKSASELDEIRIEGLNLLHIVCLKADILSLKLLLEKNVQVDPLSSEGFIPLHLAVCMKWSEGLDELVTHEASWDQIPESNIPFYGILKEVPLLTAVREGDYETSLLLLEKTIDFTLRDQNYNSILHLAASSHCTPLLSKILDYQGFKADINTPNDKGYCPLHTLLSSPNITDYEDEIVDCLHLLMQNGVNIDDVGTNSKRRTALYVAARKGLPKAVNKLLEAGSNPTVLSSDGRSLLHAACLAGSDLSLSRLLETGMVEHLVLHEDNENFSPFHMAVRGSSIECCQILLENGDHLIFRDKVSNMTKCSLAFREMKSAPELLRRVFDSKIRVSQHDKHNLHFKLEIDFSVLLSETNDIQNSIVSDITSSAAAEPLLKHPLLESYIHTKWRIIRCLFLFYVIFYLYWLGVHTIYVAKAFGLKFMMSEIKDEWTDKEMAVMHTMHVLLWIILQIPSILITCANIVKYLQHLETYIQLTAFCTAGYIVFSHDVNAPKRSQADRLVACFSIFFTWVEFVMLIGRIPQIGIYIAMFSKVTKSILKCLAAFSGLIIAFVLVFSILYESINVFGIVPIGFVKTLMMMIGEIDYSYIYDKSIDNSENNLATMIVGQIFLVLFVFLVPVLMTNLLIGIAVNDLPNLQHHGAIRILVKKATHLVAYDRIVSLVSTVIRIPELMKCLFYPGKDVKDVNRKLVIYPNKKKKEWGDATIPDDVMNEAIEIGRKQYEKKEKDINSAMITFMEEYGARQRNTESNVNELWSAVNKDKLIGVNSVLKRASGLPIKSELTLKGKYNA